MCNLYKSVKGLSTWCTSWSSNHSSPDTPLLDLKVAPQYGCIRRPLIIIKGEKTSIIKEEKTLSYWYGTGVIRNSLCYSNKDIVISKEKTPNASAMRVFDPRCGDGWTGPAVGFVKRPALFAVTDDLQVTSLTYDTSSISFLKKLNSPLNDLEQHTVKIGPYEVVNLLRASLTSKSALTEGLSYLVKKP